MAEKGGRERERERELKLRLKKCLRELYALLNIVRMKFCYKLSGISAKSCFWARVPIGKFTSTNDTHTLTTYSLYFPSWILEWVFSTWTRMGGFKNLSICLKATWSNNDSLTLVYFKTLYYLWNSLFFLRKNPQYWSLTRYWSDSFTRLYMVSAHNVVFTYIHYNYINCLITHLKAVLRLLKLYILNI